MTKTKLKAMTMCVAIIETVCEADEPVPEGFLYAGLMQYGVTLDDFQALVRTCINIGKIKTGPMKHTLVKA